MNKQTVGLYLREFLNIFALPLSFYSGLVLTRPTVFAFYLTKRCNSRCQMCNFWKNQKMSDELSYNDICSILTDLKKFGVKTISFSAEGEIFTRKDTIQILKFAKELGFVFGVNSNGLAINKELAAQIAGLQPNSVVFSIDTTDPEQYASIRGVKNGLERVIAAIHNLHECGFHRVSGGAVIRGDNVEQIPKLTAFAKEHGLHSFRFTAMQRYGFLKEWSNEEWDELTSETFTRSLRRELQVLVESMKKSELVANSVPYLEMIPKYFQAKHYYPIPCVEGYYKGKIMPNGDLSLCPIMGDKALIGNLKSDSVKKLWYSKRAKKVRHRIRNKKCPGCWLSCYGEDNLRFAPRYAFAANLKAFRRALKLVRMV